MKPGREVIEVNLPEWEALLEQARQEPLDEAGYQKLQAALRAFRHLTELIGEKDTTISRLRAVLGKPSTEKTSKVLEQAGLEPPAKSHPPQREGEPEREGETRPRTERGSSVSRRRADQNRARLHEAGGSLSGMFEGEGLPAEGACLANSGGGPGPARSQGLRVGESAL
jgi:hypothetical protein